MTDGYKIKRILVGTQQVRPAGWKPNANTLLYLPLENDAVDQTGNFTTTPSITYTTVGGVACANVGNSGGIGMSPTGIINTSLTGKTISVWVYFTSSTYSKQRTLCEFHIQNTCYFGIASDPNTTTFHSWVGNTSAGSAEFTVSAGQWMHIVNTGDSSGEKMYVNGVLVDTKTGTNEPWGHGSVSRQQGQYIGCSRNGPGDGQSVGGYLSKVIFEKVVRTADEVSAYYNKTKSKYGL